MWIVGRKKEILITAAGKNIAPAKLETMLGGGQPRGAAAAPGRSKPARRPYGAGQPSVVRHALSLVLHYPEAGVRADVEKIAGISRRGADLLQSLIETVQAEPNITTAGLLERFRHDEQGRHLGKLAATELPVDEDFDAAAELAECLESLAQAGRKARVDFLIEKQRVSGLSEDEKSELRQLY